MFKELRKIAREIELKIIISTTKFMINLVLSNTFSLKNEPTNQVASYKYLDYDIRIERDNQTCEIQRQIELGWRVFGKLQYILISDVLICLKRLMCFTCNDVWRRNIHD